MSYSYFSNYNALPASWLALAFEYADEGVPECASLADVGGAAWAVDNPNMRKAYASVSGTYVELITGADPNFDATGLNRFHFDRCDVAGGGNSSGGPCRLNGLLGPSQAPGIMGNFAAGEGAAGAFSGGLATGLVWALANDAPGAPRRSLANHTFASVLAVVTRAASTNSPTTGVAFSTQYVLWEDALLLTEAYFLPPSGGIVNVTASISFPGEGALLALLASAAAEAEAEAAAGRARTVFFSPPGCAAAAAAVRSGDLAALRSAAPPRAAAQGAPPPALRSFGVSFPAMRFDGTTNFTVAAPGTWQANALLVQPPARPPAGEGALAFRVAPNARALTWTFDSDTLVPSRNGLLSPVYAELTPESDNPTISYSLEVVPWQSGLLTVALAPKEAVSR